MDSSARAADWPALKALLQAGLEPINDINAKVRQAEVIVVVGDPSQSADIASIKMQNASRYAGATLIVLNPYRTQLSKWKTIDLRIKPNQEAAALSAVAAKLASLPRQEPKPAEGETPPPAPIVEGTLPAALPGHGLPEEAVQQAAEVLAGAKTALFALCTGHWLRGRAEDVGAALANLAIASGKVSGPGNGVIFLPEKNNSMGVIDCGLLADSLPGRRPAAEPGLTLDQMLDQANGLQALYVVGQNIDERLPDLPLLMVQDIIMSETAKRADVVFPACSYAERQGTFTNFEDRAQWFNRAIPPAGQSRPDWQIVSELARRVAQKLGKDPAPFSYNSAPQITQELEQKSAHESAGHPPRTVTPSANPVLPPLSTAIHEARRITAPRTPSVPLGDSRFLAQAPAGQEAPTEPLQVRYQPVDAAPAVAPTGEYPLVLVAAPQRWVSGATSRCAAGLLGL
ncbi:MAG: molybdopterin-dependent oxidoreductase, partial [Chloroflexota bacterium]|nr:molybdopterin-dependent oxidoreductase [Chloroflexota bacterium]